MLTPGIHRAYCAGVAALEANPAVNVVARGRSGGAYQGRPVLFETGAEAFLADHRLAEEVFGAASLVVRCRDAGEIRAVLAGLEGQLTAALHLDADDQSAAKGADAASGAQGRPHPRQRLRNRRRGRPRDGPWRPVPGDVRWAHHLRRQPGDRALPQAGLLPGHARRPVAPGASAGQSRPYLVRRMDGRIER